MSELDRLGWAVRHTFDIAGSPVGIRTTSAAFGEWLGDVLGAHRIDDEGPLRYSIVTSERKAGTRREYDILYRGCSAVLRTLDRRLLVDSLLDELEAWTFAPRDDALFLRMAPVTAHGAVALAPAYVANALIGLGKRAERAGITLPAQLHVAVDRSAGTVIPIPRALNIHAAALDRVGEPGPRDRYLVSEPVKPKGLLFFAESGEPVEPLSRGIALYRVAGSAFNLPAAGGEGFRALGRLVGDARCFAVNVVEPADILDAVSQALREIAG
jgi:hypothetical protein